MVYFNQLQRTKPNENKQFQWQKKKKKKKKLREWGGNEKKLINKKII